MVLHLFFNSNLMQLIKPSLSPKGLAISLALISAVCMLIISLIGLTGYGQDAIALTQAYFFGYKLSFLGIVLGILEGALLGFVSGWLLAVLHNKFA